MWSEIIHSYELILGNRHRERESGTVARFYYGVARFQKGEEEKSECREFKLAREFFFCVLA